MANRYYKKTNKTNKKYKTKKSNKKTIIAIVVSVVSTILIGLLFYAPIKNYITETKLDTNISTSEEKKGKYIVDISTYFTTPEDDKFVGITSGNSSSQFGSENGYSFVVSTNDDPLWNTNTHY